MPPKASSEYGAASKASSWGWSRNLILVSVVRITGRAASLQTQGFALFVKFQFGCCLVCLSTPQAEAANARTPVSIGDREVGRPPGSRRTRFLTGISKPRCLVCGACRQAGGHVSAAAGRRAANRDSGARISANASVGGAAPSPRRFSLMAAGPAPCFWRKAVLPPRFGRHLLCRHCAIGASAACVRPEEGQGIGRERFER
jgi:hypothetical protein